MDPVNVDTQSQLDTLKETIKGMKERLDYYESKEKAEEKLKKAEELAEKKFEQVKEAEEREQEKLNEVVEALFQEKLKQWRSQSKVKFPISLRQGNLSKADKQLLDIIMRKAPITTVSNPHVIDEDLARELLRYKEQITVVRPLFRNINMPTNPYTFPMRLGPAAVHYQPQEVTGIASSDIATDEATIIAKKLMSFIEVSTEEGEDSIIPILPELKQAMAEGFAEAEEKAIIQGDTAGSFDANDPRKAFDGLLKKAGATVNLGGQQSDEEGGTFIKPMVATEINRARAALKNYGHRASDLVWIVPLDFYLEHLLVAPGPNGESPLVTVDKYGQHATILNGEVGKLFGITVVVSEGFEPPVNVADGGKSQKTLLVNRGSQNVIIGSRRGITVKTDEDIKLDKVDVVGTERIGMVVPFPQAVANVTVYWK